MYHVCATEGILNSFDKFEEAEAYIENEKDSDDMWISYEDEWDGVDECGYDPYVGDYTYDC